MLQVPIPEGYGSTEVGWVTKDGNITVRLFRPTTPRACMDKSTASRTLFHRLPYCGCGAW